MPFNRGPFTTSLLSVSGTPLNANFTSTLQVNASRTITRTETTVTCLYAASESETDNFTVAGMQEYGNNHSKVAYTIYVLLYSVLSKEKKSTIIHPSCKMIYLFNPMLIFI